MEIRSAGLRQVQPEALDFLNRQSERARRRFHICLLLGHLISKVDQQDEALAQVRTCASDFPGFEPELSRYQPSSMRSFFERAHGKVKAVLSPLEDRLAKIEKENADLKAALAANGKTAKAIERGNAPPVGAGGPGVSQDGVKFDARNKDGSPMTMQDASQKWASQK